MSEQTKERKEEGRTKENMSIPDRVRGHVRAILRDTKTGKEQFFDLGENIVVNDASIIVASLVTDPTSRVGLTHLAVGTGYGTGTPQNPQPAERTDDKLETELFRKVFNRTAFIDGDGNETVTPTSVVDYETIFTETEAVGPITEMGLLSSTTDVVGDTANTMLFNHRRISVMNKPSTATLTIIFRISY